MSLNLLMCCVSPGKAQKTLSKVAALTAPSGFIWFFPMDPSKVLFWNVRGLNNKARRDSVRVAIDNTKPDIVCLQETKKASISRHMILSLLGSDFEEYVVLPAACTRGGIILAWRILVCKMLQTRIDNFQSLLNSSSRMVWLGGLRVFMVPNSMSIKFNFLMSCA